MSTVSEPDPDASERAAAAGRVLLFSQAGFDLLTGYFAIAAVVMIAVAVVAGHGYGRILLLGLVLGVILLTAVSIANRRAWKRLRARWPFLCAVSRDGKHWPPNSLVAGIFYFLALTGVVALAAVAGDIAGAARASAKTEVSISTCTQGGRQEQSCQASWRADGRVYHGTITWSSDPYSTAAAVYNPSQPATVYSASDRFLDGTTVIGTIWFLIWLSVGAVIFRFNIQSRARYLAGPRSAIRAARPEPAPGSEESPAAAS